MEILSETSSKKYAAQVSPHLPGFLYLNVSDLSIYDSGVYTCNLGNY